MLGIYIDLKLNFNLHLDKICQSVSNQLNGLTRLKRCLGKDTRNVPVNSFIYSNFNYLPLTWMLSSVKSIAKIESL